MIQYIESSVQIETCECMCKIHLKPNSFKKISFKKRISGKQSRHIFHIYRQIPLPIEFFFDEPRFFWVDFLFCYQDCLRSLHVEEHLGRFSSMVENLRG